MAVQQRPGASVGAGGVEPDASMEPGSVLPQLTHRCEADVARIPALFKGLFEKDRKNAPIPPAHLRIAALERARPKLGCIAARHGMFCINHQTGAG